LIATRSSPLDSYSGTPTHADPLSQRQELSLPEAVVVAQIGWDLEGDRDRVGGLGADLANLQLVEVRYGHGAVVSFLCGTGQVPAAVAAR
jgi:hypothetical protein